MANSNNGSDLVLMESYLTCDVEAIFVICRISNIKYHCGVKAKVWVA